MDASSYQPSTFQQVIVFAVAVLVIVGMYKMFQKAGLEGWKAIIPFYNMYLLYKLSWGNGWLFLITCIPCVGFIFNIIVSIKTAKAFGKGTGFGIGLWLVPCVFYMILGFDDSQYLGPQ